MKKILFALVLCLSSQAFDAGFAWKLDATTIQNNAASTTQIKSAIAPVGTLPLGTAGSVVGGVQLFNATSGSITISPPTGALGTVALTLPGATGTLALTSGTITNATNTAITNDTSTNATVYPTWVTANTGNLPQKVSSTKLSFNPSTGLLSIANSISIGGGINSDNGAFTSNGDGNVIALTYNKLTLTQPASAATLTIADGKTLTASNTLTFTGTDASSVAFGAGGTVLYQNGPLGTPSSGVLTNCTGVTVGGGGTGLSGGTSGGVLYFSGASTLASSGQLAANSLVFGGGAATAPLTSTAFTTSGVGAMVFGVSGASTGSLKLACANTGSVRLIPDTGDGGDYTITLPVGATGLMVVENGPLGIPASGTLTNCTGLPISGLVSSTSTALGLGSIELGHASDTTIARTSAGQITVEGVQVATLSNSVSLSNKTLTSPVISAGLTASGSSANTFAGSTGSFQTSSGDNTFNGQVTLNEASTPSLDTAPGKTNTGYLNVQGKTSGNFKITTADATARSVTMKPAAQTAGDTILTVPDMAGANDSFVMLALGQTLTNKTFVAPILGTPTSGTLTNCTGLPVAGITASTSTALGVGSIELGHASDTTIARVSAGVISVEGVTVPTISSTNTITNKRNQPRVVSATSYTTDTGTSLDLATTDDFVITAQAGALKFNNPSGTPQPGEKFTIRIKDSGSNRALTYDTQYRASSDLALPTTTTTGKTLYMLFKWNSTDSRWDMLAKLDNF